MTTIRRPVRRSSRSSASTRTVLLCALIGSVLLLLVWPSAKKQDAPNLRASDTQQELHSAGSLDAVLSRSQEFRGKPSAANDHDTKLHTLVEEDKTQDETMEQQHDEQDVDAATDHEEHHQDAAEAQLEHEVHVNYEEEEEHQHEQEPPDLPAEDGTSTEVHGNHVTLKSFVADYHYDRQNPAFREDAPSALLSLNGATSAAHVASLLHPPPGTLNPCRYLSPDGRLALHEACEHESKRNFIAYNGNDFERRWCGTVIAPHTAVKYDFHCSQPVRLFSNINPPVSGEGMPPIVIQEHTKAKKLDEVACDIPCEEEHGMKGTTRFIQGTNWTLIQSSDDPFENKVARVEGNAFREDKYYSTTSFKSNVPLSFFTFEDYDISKVQAIDYEDFEPSASYLVDEKCNSAGSKRNRWVGAVANNYPVAHYGSCDHDTELPEGMSLSNRLDRIKIHQKHLFNLAFEASTEKDHITHVIWDAFQSGSVPVILGPSNLKQHLPPHSYISSGDFQQWDQLGKYVAKVAANRTLWESYHEWRRDKDAVQAFNDMYEFTRTSPSCRMCRWAYSKKYGLGWSHEKQIVRENVISRQHCVDMAANLVHSPFIESWARLANGNHINTTSADKEAACDSSSSRVVDAAGVTVHRTVTLHDGVVDILILEVWRHHTHEDIVFQMELPVKNREGASFPNSHMLTPTANGARCSSVTIQDERARVSVLADWDADIRVVGEGKIEVKVLASKEQRLEKEERRTIRIIPEDVNTLSDKVTEFYPSSFGQLMTKDFIDPLELYFVES